MRATVPTVPERVLDLFAVPGDVRSLPGGQGASVVAGDLVLSPGRDPAVASWLSPLLARLAVGLDERPGRPGVRLAVPVPARDGAWVVDGWGASRWEPGSRACTDLGVLVAAGRVLHAELAAVLRRRPAALDGREDRWAVAERLAFGPPEPALAAAASRRVPGLVDLVDALTRLAGPAGATGRPEQLVHADLAGNVLLDARGVPVVIDLAPAWRPEVWAEAVCVLDAVTWLDADACTDADLGRPLRPGPDDLARAAVFRLLSDATPDVARYRAALGRLGVVLTAR